MALGTVNVGQAQNDRSNFVTTDQVGVAGGVATLGGDGKLTASQVPAIDHYTQQQTNNAIAQAVSAHNADQTAHGDIRADLTNLDADLQGVILRFGTTVTGNPFSVSFGSLDGLTVTGVWNKNQARIEF